MRLITNQPSDLEEQVVKRNEEEEELKLKEKRRTRRENSRV